MPAPLQWFVGCGIRPLKTAQLLVQMCKSPAGHAAIVRQWRTWQPVIAFNWQLADSCLTAYQQQCQAAKERPLKGMTAMLSSMPSRYRLLLAVDLPGKVVLLQQQLNLSAAGTGGLVAAGLHFSGSIETVAATAQWLVSFAGSQEAAAGMLRAAPNLLNYSVATLDSKAAALQAAWAGSLQPEQVRQLVMKSGKVLTNCRADQYAPTAAVLRSWFAQPSELYTVLQSASKLAATPATALQANERWFTGPPLSLSRQQFLARVQAAPQAFFQNFEEALMQRKLAFVTQVGAAPKSMGCCRCQSGKSWSGQRSSCCMLVFFLWAYPVGHLHRVILSQVGGVPLERALSASHLNYLKHSMEALAGRYFLLTQHGVPMSMHEDSGIVPTYAGRGLPTLLHRLREHDSAARLPADNAAALAYLRKWLAAWPETESGRRWAQPRD